MKEDRVEEVQAEKVTVMTASAEAKKEKAVKSATAERTVKARTTAKQREEAAVPKKNTRSAKMAKRTALVSETDTKTKNVENTNKTGKSAKTAKTVESTNLIKAEKTTKTTKTAKTAKTTKTGKTAKTTKTARITTASSSKRDKNIDAAIDTAVAINTAIDIDADNDSSNDCVDVARRAIELSETIKEATVYMLVKLEADESSPVAMMLHSIGEGLIGLDNAISLLISKTEIEEETERMISENMLTVTNQLNDMIQLYFKERFGSLKEMGKSFQATYQRCDDHLSGCFKSMTLN